MPRIIRRTRSVCPVCLKNIPADLNQHENGYIYLEKTCPEHGLFKVPIWKGNIDFESWIQGFDPLPEEAGLACPQSCGIYAKKNSDAACQSGCCETTGGYLCSEHASETCCILLEVTSRCNLRCRYCFADGGQAIRDPSIETLKSAITDIVRKCGQPLIQFSGGEPTLRDDLPELVRFAKEAGCSYTQVNTNGIRIAKEPEYAHRLADAGLDIVFLQFDGLDDDIYLALRGMPLLEQKKKAIEVCARLGLGVTLVPTVVKGINDMALGDIIGFACQSVPSVRGIHFQPVSYFGRYPGEPSEADRYTLDQLITDICDQTDIAPDSFLPSRCDHPLCGFHARFTVSQYGRMTPLSSITHSPRVKGCARDNREYIARNWQGVDTSADLSKTDDTNEEMDFDTFLFRLKNQSLTLTAMAFQDAMNLNIERLHRCSLHVYDHGLIKPFCSRYLTPFS